MDSLRTVRTGNPWALLPFGFFLLLFIGSGLLTGDFYKLPVLVAILIAAASALAMNRKETFDRKVEIFCRGAGHPNIMLMVMIFLLAGAFSEVSKGMGAVESTVNLALTAVPQQWLLAGIFVIACFLSVSMGTSVGTIVALAPIGAGISGETGLSMALTMAAVIGGSMFGDNLSFISDTTIAAVRTQHTRMKDKFKVNFFIVLPAAILTCILLAALATGAHADIGSHPYHWVKILPYAGVLVAALLGVNVFLVLAGGIVLSGIIGLVDGSYTFGEVFQKVGDGMAGMFEIAFLAIFIAGTVEIIKHNGGIDYLLGLVTRRIRTKKGAELSIAGLVTLTNMSTANNTVSIMIAGPLAKTISDQYEVDPRKSASVLDIFSCFVQGLLPYGAQLLVAAEIAGISPVSILPFSFYPVLIAIAGLVAIAAGFPKWNKEPRIRE